MVAGEHDYSGLGELCWRAIALTGRHPHRQVFQATQRPTRLGQGVLPPAGGGGGPAVGRGDFAELHHIAAFIEVIRGRIHPV
jgi:hypothetical protein